MEVSSALIPQFSSVETGPPPLLLPSFGSACGSTSELLTTNADCVVIRDLVGKEEGESTIGSNNINNNSNHVHMYEADSSGMAVLASIQAHSTYPHLPMDLFANIGPSQQQQQSQHQQLGGAALDLSVLQQQQQQQASPPPQLNAPTMHPNLVSTLKSIISSSRGQGEEFIKQQESTSCQESMANAVRDDHPSTALGLRHLQTLCNAAPASAASASLGVSTLAQDDRQAAVVPLDLIRNRRPYKCGFSGCNKTFKNPQTLRMHWKTHCVSSCSSSEEARSRGGSRGQAFHSLATVPSSSKAGHNKKIPSRCPVCDRSFVGLYELRRHFGRKHSEGEKAHACSKCNKRFHIEVDLRDHEKLCGEPLVCKCGIKFAFKCNLVAHKKTHPCCQDTPPPPSPSAPTSMPAGSLLFPPFLQQQHHRPPLSSLLPQSAAPLLSASLILPAKPGTTRSWCITTTPPPSSLSSSSESFQLSTLSSSEGRPAANASWLSTAVPGVGPVII